MVHLESGGMFEGRMATDAQIRSAVVATYNMAIGTGPGQGVHSAKEAADNHFSDFSERIMSGYLNNPEEGKRVIRIRLRSLIRMINRLNVFIADMLLEFENS